MKVVLMNGSRREKGCTYTAMTLVAEELNKAGIDTEILHVGGADSMNGNINKLVDSLAEKVKEADGIVIGSPVYYASPSGEILAVLDRLFGKAENDLRYKPCAVLASARRAGTTATLDVLNKYASYCEMPLVTSRYWNMVHGSKPEDVLQDKEGVQIMQVLGKNMAWMLKSIEAGKKAGVEQPQPVEKEMTNFIR